MNPVARFPRSPTGKAARWFMLYGLPLCYVSSCADAECSTLPHEGVSCRRWTSAAGHFAGFCLFSPVGVHLVPLKMHDFKGFRPHFDWILTGFQQDCNRATPSSADPIYVAPILQGLRVKRRKFCTLSFCCAMPTNPHALGVLVGNQERPAVLSLNNTTTKERW